MTCDTRVQILCSFNTYLAKYSKYYASIIINTSKAIKAMVETSMVFPDYL